MKTLDIASIENFPETNWQILGKLELMVSPETDQTMRAWLASILSPLNLHMEFLNRIQKSAQEAWSRALHGETVNEIQPAHLLIFVPQNYASHRQNWGFFRIEKMDSTEQNKERPQLDVEFYLYPEGQ